ncbi:SAM-dependent methyltransferase [Microbispora sp. RL4-1S]|uniref:SAM-dependent methyltransferase n=1 Tax=Microbispora oryzae TaxID=2806554 RepID=A0A941AQG9_9ACTN|nr:SAM-dependent methyltransferase [Microbispora oryzae]MBP2704714.1 SAM-dependent methyltransferase [Microbispora oryzae]
MTEPDSSAAPPLSSRIDTNVPQSARVWNYLLGGKDNFPADRAAADGILSVFPQMRDIARADRAFLGRAVRHLAGEAGIRQFLDIGTGLPTMNNTHEVAQQVAPDARIVYVDNDPLVLVHAHALLVGSPEGVVDYIDADLREPEAIIEAAAKTLDYGRPVAIMLLGILHFVGDDGDARAILDRLLGAVPSGSYLVLTHATLDIGDQSSIQANAQANEDWNEKAPQQISPRTREEIIGLLDGLELLEPGLVSMSHWRPEETPWGTPAEVAGYAVVARKP